MHSFRIQPSEDFAGLQVLFHRNGLEVRPDERDQSGLLGLWQALSTEDDAVLGGLKMEERAGLLVLSCIAVEPAYRGTQVGAALLQCAIDFAKTRGAPRLFLVAKVPTFFKKFGFCALPMQPYRQITKCYDCPQRGISCQPELLCLTLATTQAQP